MNVIFQKECFIYPRTYVPGETAILDREIASRLINAGIAAPARETDRLKTTEHSAVAEITDKPAILRKKHVPREE